MRSRVRRSPCVLNGVQNGVLNGALVRALIGALALWGQPAFSADASADLADLSLDDLLNVKVTTASRIAQTRESSPASTTVFTRRELEQLGVQHLSQLLALVPGILPLYEPHEGRANMLSGRGTPESYGQGFLVLLDGQRLNEDYTGGYTLANRFITLDNIDRVEIIRGPGSALYGANAFSGVIQLFTRDSGNRVTVTAGAFGRAGISVQHSNLQGDLQIQSFVRVYKDNGDHYENLFDRFGKQSRSQDPRETRDLQFKFAGKQFFANLRHTEHQLDDYYQFGRLSDGINQDWNAQQNLRAGYRFDGEDGQGLAGVGGQIAISTSRLRWQPMARFALQDSSDFRFGDWINSPRIDYRNQELNADLYFSYPGARKFNVGLSASHASIPHATPISNYDVIDFHWLGGLQKLLDPRYRSVDDKDRRSVGVYAQIQQALSDLGTLTLGVRHDHFNDIGGATSPRIAWVFQPTSADSFKLMYGRAFRAPGLGDLYDREAGQTVGNPHLGAIEARSLEAVWLRRINTVWHTGLTLFDNLENNLLSSVPLPDGRTLISNVGEHQARGAELELLATPNDDWRISASWTEIFDSKTHGIRDAGAALAEQFAPDRHASLIVNYRYQDLNFNLNGHWRRDIPVLPKDQGGWDLNASFQWQWRADVSLQLDIWNLLDEDLAVAARGSALGRNAQGQRERSLPLRGREWQLSLRKEW